MRGSFAVLACVVVAGCRPTGLDPYESDCGPPGYMDGRYAGSR